MVLVSVVECGIAVGDCLLLFSQYLRVSVYKHSRNKTMHFAPPDHLKQTLNFLLFFTVCIDQL